MYPSATLLLRGWLAQRYPTRRVLTETPGDMDGEPEVIQVGRYGGADRVLTLDVADVDVDVYAASWAAADALAHAVWVALRTALPGSTLTTPTGYAPADSAVVARVQTISAPAQRPVSNPALRRAGAAYRLTLHSS